MADSFTKEGGIFDRKDRVVGHVDALDIIRQSVIDRLPKKEELPKSLDLNSRISFIPEAHTNTDSISIFESMRMLNGLTTYRGNEFGTGLIVSPSGDIGMGPIIEGDSDSVNIDIPLKRTEFTSPSGLTVYRDEVCGATLHTHPNNYSFSLQDIYAGKRSFKSQEYVIGEHGIIDMLQLTEETKLINNETFRRLLDLWDTYLKSNGQLRDDMSASEHAEFLIRVSKVLECGFYTNEGQDDESILVLR